MKTVKIQLQQYSFESEKVIEAYNKMSSDVKKLQLDLGVLWGNEEEALFTKIPRSIEELVLILDDKDNAKWMNKLAALPTQIKKLSYKNPSHTLEKLLAIFANIPRAVKTLDLSEMNLSPYTADGLDILFKKLPANITSFNLSKNNLSKYDALELEKIFAALPNTVTSLDISGNDLHKYKTNQLIQIFSRLPPKLQKLNIRFNQIINYDGVKRSPQELTQISNVLTKIFFIDVEFKEITSHILNPQEQEMEFVKNATAFHDKAVTIQKNARGFLSRKRYGIKYLNKDESTKYETMILGNDPEAVNFDKYREPDAKIAVVGTGGLRVIEIACELGNQKKPPKVIVVDNSELVYQFWVDVKKFFLDDKQSESQALFSKHFPAFLKQHQNLYRKQDEIEKKSLLFLNKLFDKNGYNYIRHLIQSTTVIKQSWTDEETFKSIKNNLDHLNIKKVFAYPSNILAYLNYCNNNEGFLAAAPARHTNKYNTNPPISKPINALAT